jgi:hypothetical protein
MSFRSKLQKCQYHKGYTAGRPSGGVGEDDRFLDSDRLIDRSVGFVSQITAFRFKKQSKQKQKQKQKQYKVKQVSNNITKAKQ